MKIAGLTFLEDGIYDSTKENAGPVHRFDDIDSCTLRVGRLSASPLLQLIIACVLLGCGVLGAIVVWRWTQSGGSISGVKTGGLLVLGMIGVWLMLDLRKTGYYLLVRGKVEVVRLPFVGPLSDAELVSLEEFFRKREAPAFLNEIIRK